MNLQPKNLLSGDSHFKTEELEIASTPSLWTFRKQDRQTDQPTDWPTDPYLILDILFYSLFSQRLHGLAKTCIVGSVSPKTRKGLPVLFGWKTIPGFSAVAFLVWYLTNTCFPCKHTRRDAKLFCVLRSHSLNLAPKTIPGSPRQMLFGCLYLFLMAILTSTYIDGETESAPTMDYKPEPFPGHAEDSESSDCHRLCSVQPSFSSVPFRNITPQPSPFPLQLLVYFYTPYGCSPQPSFLISLSLFQSLSHTCCIDSKCHTTWTLPAVCLPFLTVNTY